MATTPDTVTGLYHSTINTVQMSCSPVVYSSRTGHCLFLPSFLKFRWDARLVISSSGTSSFCKTSYVQPSLQEHETLSGDQTRSL